MKKNPISTLIKDAITIAIAAALGFALGTALENPAMAMLLAFFGAGVPFGWRWISKVVTAVSFDGILMKLAGASLLGFVGAPIVLVVDTVKVLVYLSASRRSASMQNA